MDPFRSLILAQIEAILEKEPCTETLYELLKVTTPKFNEAELYIAGKPSKLYKKLKTRVHPDKHPNDSVRATQIFQLLDPFFGKCVQILYKEENTRSRQKRKKKPTSTTTRSSPTSTGFPIEFNVRDKWSFLSLRQKSCKKTDIPSQVAFQCINARGAIAHGGKTSLKYDVKKEANPFRTVDEVFHSHGGSKKFDNIADIKSELMARGPLVSTSFVLTKDFMNTGKNNGFDRDMMGKNHPVLVIGWKISNSGEVWLIQPLVRSTSATEMVKTVTFGRFGIDDKLVAPTNSFYTYPWEPGPHFDLDFSKTPEWRSWPGIKKNITGKDLEKLGEILGDINNIITASANKKIFVLRDRRKLAHSKTCYLKKIKFVTGTKPWCIEVSFTTSV